MTFYSVKSEIVTCTCKRQRFFDVIKPLEINKKPEEKVTQNHLKDQLQNCFYEKMLISSNESDT